MQEYSSDEIATHKTDKDCWVILDASCDPSHDDTVPQKKLVYDLSSFLDDHPGGPAIIMDLAGQDVTDEFEDIGHSMDARKLLAPFIVGTLKELPSKDHRFKYVAVGF